VDLLDLVGLQVELRRLGGNAARDLLELIARAADHSAGAGAGWRAVAVAQAALAVLAAALEFRVGQVLDLHVTYLRRCSTTCRSAVQRFFAQPFGEPGQMTIAIEWIRGEVPVKGERSKKCDSMGHKKTITITALIKGSYNSIFPPCPLYVWAFDKLIPYSFGAIVSICCSHSSSGQPNPWQAL